jgi:hypothetical protein
LCEADILERIGGVLKVTTAVAGSVVLLGSVVARKAGS